LFHGERNIKRDVGFGFLSLSYPASELLLAGLAWLSLRKENGDTAERKRQLTSGSMSSREEGVRRWHYGVESAYNSVPR
jgi:hypothetical protein